MNAESLKREIRACTFCAEHLPLGPKPIVQFSASSRVVVIGQAPGRITHHSGIPFDDKAGERLAGWLGLTFEQLHDPARIAIVSMGLCYPGKAKGGDKPPRPECAPLWHEKVWRELPDDRLMLLVGTYAQKAYLPETKSWTMAKRTAAFREFLPRYLPLPHPAWRSTLFMRDHPWFEADVLPTLRRAVAERISA